MAKHAPESTGNNRLVPILTCHSIAFLSTAIRALCSMCLIFNVCKTEEVRDVMMCVHPSVHL